MPTAAVAVSDDPVGHDMSLLWLRRLAPQEPANLVFGEPSALSTVREAWTDRRWGGSLTTGVVMSGYKC